MPRPMIPTAGQARKTVLRPFLQLALLSVPVNKQLVPDRDIDTGTPFFSNHTICALVLFPMFM